MNFFDTSEGRDAVLLIANSLADIAQNQAEAADAARVINRIRASYSDFLESAKLKNRKSEYVTCPECGSKINIPALVKYRGEKMHSCPLCGTSLWSKSTMERNRSFNQRIEKAEREYEELEAKNNKKSSADLGWCVKVEVHC